MGKPNLDHITKGRKFDPQGKKHLARPFNAGNFGEWPPLETKGGSNFPKNSGNEDVGQVLGNKDVRVDNSSSSAESLGVTEPIHKAFGASPGNDKVSLDTASQSLGIDDTIYDVDADAEDIYDVDNGIDANVDDNGSESRYPKNLGKSNNMAASKVLDKKPEPNKGLKSWVELFPQNRSNVHGFNLDQRVIKHPKMVIEGNRVEDIRKTWGHSLVGYIAGKSVGKLAIIDCCKAWKVKFQIHFETNGWVVMVFDSEEDLSSVLANGPYMIFGRAFILKVMPPYFMFDVKESSKVPMWVKFPRLPLELWNVDILSELTSRIGRPIRSDQLTQTMKRISFARVFVEVDLSMDLVYDVLIELPNKVEYVQSVEYEYVPKYCKGCKMIGHSDFNCDHKAPEKVCSVSEGVTKNGIEGDPGGAENALKKTTSPVSDGPVAAAAAAPFLAEGSSVAAVAAAAQAEVSHVAAASVEACPAMGESARLPADGFLGPEAAAAALGKDCPASMAAACHAEAAVVDDGHAKDAIAAAGPVHAAAEAEEAARAAKLARAAKKKKKKQREAASAIVPQDLSDDDNYTKDTDAIRLRVCASWGYVEGKEALISDEDFELMMEEEELELDAYEAARKLAFVSKQKKRMELRPRKVAAVRDGLTKGVESVLDLPGD